MDQDKIRRLEEAKIDIHELYERMCNKEELVLKFLNKFLEDENFLELQKSYVKKDPEVMLRYAHTLKGISANLNMFALNQACSAMVKHIREQELSLLDKDYQDICQEYQVVVSALKDVLK